MANPFGITLDHASLRWAAAEGVPESVIAAINLLDTKNVDEIVSRLTPAELEQVLRIVGRSPNAYRPGVYAALKGKRDLAPPQADRPKVAPKKAMPLKQAAEERPRPPRRPKALPQHTVDAENRASPPLLRKCQLADVWAALLLGVYLLTVSAAAQPPRRVETSQPLNLGSLKERLRTYKSTGAYNRDLRKVAAEAETCIKDLAKRTTRPALVLDIDETALSNWPQIIANDFGYIPAGSCRLPKGPCGSRAWELLGRAPVIEPTLKLFRAARASGVSIFFITGRDETERSATVANLRRAGYRGWASLTMRPVEHQSMSVAEFKAQQRTRIEQHGFKIIGNVGDQPNDFQGGPNVACALQLPNPFYRIP